MIPWWLINIVVADRMFGDTHLFGPDNGRSTRSYDDEDYIVDEGVDDKYPTDYCRECKKFRGLGVECGGGYTYYAGRSTNCKRKK